MVGAPIKSECSVDVNSTIKGELQWDLIAFMLFNFANVITTKLTRSIPSRLKFSGSSNGFSKSSAMIHASKPVVTVK
jgi:hypothetical protein